MIRSALGVVGAIVALAMTGSPLAHADSTQAEVLLKVQDSSCVTCTSAKGTLMKISRELRSLDGVNKTRINLAKQQVWVEFDQSVTSSTELGIRLTEMGYRATRYENHLGTSIASN